MINIILNCFLSISLFISGGHILSSNFKSHHYSDEDYKDIFYLKNYDSISKYCTKHSEFENIKFPIDQKIIYPTFVIELFVNCNDLLNFSF